LDQPLELSDEGGGIETDRVREVQEFDHVDPSLAAFDPRDVGLPPSESVS
jgi:hypothetical protein